MIGGKRQLEAVVAEAIHEVDERYDGYRVSIAKAFVAVVGTQETAATETSRREAIQGIVESLGDGIVAAKGGPT